MIRRLPVLLVLMVVLTLTVLAQNPGPGGTDGKCPGPLCGRVVATKTETVRNSLRLTFANLIVRFIR